MQQLSKKCSGRTCTAINVKMGSKKQSAATVWIEWSNRELSPYEATCVFYSFVMYNIPYRMMCIFL
jgi:hypothetical protein